MLDHLGIPVSDLKKSKQFYTQALAPLGYRLLADLVEYDAAGFGAERPQFWIGKGEPSWKAEGPHICFMAKDSAEVRAFYEAALRAGGKDNGKPGLRPHYHEKYYGAFVYDLDGYNIEACCHNGE